LVAAYATGIYVELLGRIRGVDSVEIVKRLLQVVPKPAVARDA